MLFWGEIGDNTHQRIYFCLQLCVIHIQIKITRQSIISSILSEFYSNSKNSKATQVTQENRVHQIFFYPQEFSRSKQNEFHTLLDFYRASKSASVQHLILRIKNFGQDFCFKFYATHLYSQFTISIELLVSTTTYKLSSLLSISSINSSSPKFGIYLALNLLQRFLKTPKRVTCLILGFSSWLFDRIDFCLHSEEVKEKVRVP